MIKGYHRVSTNSQQLDEGLKRLEELGCEEIYAEKYTGTQRMGRKELERLLEDIDENDVIYCLKVDRMARSITDLREIVESIIEKGATINFIDNNLKFNKVSMDDPMQKMTLNMLGVFSELERDFIVARTRAGKEYARANNPNFKEGRKRKLSSKQIESAYELLQSKTYREVAEVFKISKQTLITYIKEYKLANRVI